MTLNELAAKVKDLTRQYLEGAQNEAQADTEDWCSMAQLYATARAELILAQSPDDIGEIVHDVLCQELV